MLSWKTKSKPDPILRKILIYRVNIWWQRNWERYQQLQNFFAQKIWSVIDNVPLKNVLWKNKFWLMCFPFLSSIQIWQMCNLCVFIRCLQCSRSLVKCIELNWVYCSRCLWIGPSASPWRASHRRQWFSTGAAH